MQGFHFQLSIRMQRVQESLYLGHGNNGSVYTKQMEQKFLNVCRLLAFLYKSHFSINTKTG